MTASAITIALESPRQPDAVALYRKAGFVARGPYADYPDIPESLFMERPL